MNSFYDEDVWVDENEFQDYTNEEIEMLLAKYDIDLTDTDEEADEFSPLLQRHKK